MLFVRFIIAVALLLLGGSTAGVPGSIKEYKRSLKSDQQSGGCFKILTRERAYGCDNSAANGENSRGILQFVSDMQALPTSKRALAMPLSLLPEFVSRVESDPGTVENAVAVLVIQGDGDVSFSSGDVFPNKHFPNGTAFYPGRNYDWNPTGTGLRYKLSPVPIFLVEPTLVGEVKEKAQKNRENDFKGALFHVDVDMSMHAQDNSTECLQERDCLPIGGHSVMALYPPLSYSAAAHLESAILVLAAMDSAGFFLDSVTGADASLSGLITMLTTIDILSAQNDVHDYKHRLVFAALAGEPWDYMGSRRMVVELTPGEHSVFGTTPPLELSSIQKIVEIGQVGQPSKLNDNYQLFLHSYPKQASHSVQEAFQKMAEDSQAHVDVLEASDENPGLPPSSLMTWLTVDDTIEGLVLEEFDQHFINRNYESFMDDATQLDIEALTRVAILVSKALHGLATEEESTALQVNETQVRKRVEDLVGCLALDEPGLKCSMAQDLMSVDPRSAPRTSNVEHYLTVLSSIDTDIQESKFDQKSNFERFIFNFMGQKLQHTPPDLDSLKSCDFSDLKCSANDVCIGHKAMLSGAKQRGRCLQTSVYFVPSYSLSLNYTHCADKRHCGWNVLSGPDHRPDRIAESYGWHPDRIWTESNWPADPKFSLYLVETRDAEIKILVAGVFLTAATVLLSFLTRLIGTRSARWTV